MIRLQGTHRQVDPQHDDILVAGRKDRPSFTFYRSCHGAGVYYAYRAAQHAFGGYLHERCEPVTLSDLQAEIDRIAEYDTLGEYADIERLRALGLTIPTDAPRMIEEL